MKTLTITLDLDHPTFASPLNVRELKATLSRAALLKAIARNADDTGTLCADIPVFDPYDRLIGTASVSNTHD